MADEVELRAFRYSERVGGSRNKDSYKKEPFKFLWAYSGEKAKETNIQVANSRRGRMVWEHAQGKKILGKVLLMRAPGLPRFGSIYQETGSNFILHSDNITRVIKIPYFPKTTQTKIVSPYTWYIDSIYWALYIFNLMNLIFSCVALIYFVKDTYYFYMYFSSNLNPMKGYLSFFLFMIIAMAFIFSIGHAMSGTHSLALVYLYIFLNLISCFVMGFFQEYYNFKERVYNDFKRDLNRAFFMNEDIYLFARIQTELQCCGVSSPSDWEILGHIDYPRSCCPQPLLRDEDTYIFDCTHQNAYLRPCADAAKAFFDDLLSIHNYMLWGKIFFQWLAILIALIYAIAIYNGGLEQKNNINFSSAVPVEYFNIVTKGEVEFCLPMNYYEKQETEDYKYMILMNDIRQAIKERQMKYFNERRYMYFDVV